MSQAVDTEDRLLVNKSELARLLNVAVPTVGKLIDDYPDLPVIDRGTNGKAWVFDAHEVMRYLEGQRAADRHEAEARNKMWAQVSLPLDEVQATDGGVVLSATQREKLASARLKERKLAMEEGHLVNKSELRMALSSVVGGFGRFLDNLPGQIGRRHQLPEEVIRSIKTQIDEQRRSFVKEMQGLLETEGDSVRH